METDEIATTGTPGGLMQDPSVASAMAREQAMIQSAAVLAIQAPRSVAKARQAIMQHCRRPDFAKLATYKYPRGNTQIKGPSVNLARVMAAEWGNVRFGFEVLGQTATEIHLRGGCWDLETNAFRYEETRMPRKIQRKNKQTGVTEWITPEPRESREMANKTGAIVERNAILKIIPKDILDEAIEECNKTLFGSSEAALQKDRDGAVKKVIAAFEQIYVTVEMLEKRLDHPLSEITAEERVELLEIYNSINDGNSAVHDHFGEKKRKHVVDSAKIDLGDIKESKIPAERPEKPKPEQKEGADKKSGWPDENIAGLDGGATEATIKLFWTLKGKLGWTEEQRKEALCGKSLSPQEKNNFIKESELLDITTVMKEEVDKIKQQGGES